MSGQFKIIKEMKEDINVNLLREWYVGEDVEKEINYLEQRVEDCLNELDDEFEKIAKALDLYDAGAASQDTVLEPLRDLLTWERDNEHKKR